MNMQGRVLKFIEDRGIVVLSEHVIVRMFGDVETEMGAFCEKYDLSRSIFRCGEHPMTKLMKNDIGKVE